MVLKLSNETIKDVAQDLDLGMECYLHKQTSEVVKFPDRDRWLGDEEELWKEAVEKIENNPDDYYKIDKMPSREAYIVMEEFVETVTDRQIQQVLINAIAGQKPFAAFNSTIHQLNAERQAWFIYKLTATEAWIRLQMH